MARTKFSAATNGEIIGYLVRWCVTVDHPEMRNDSFAPVKAGTKVPSKRFTASRADALACFDGLVRGGDNFASEYVSSASVVAMRQYCDRAETIRSARMFGRAPDGRVVEIIDHKL